MALAVLVLLPLSLHGQEPDLREVVRRHIRAVGKLDAFQRLSSYSMRGTMEQGDQTTPFVLYKRGNNLRCELDTQHPLGRLILLYDGRNTWQWLQHDVSTRIEPMPAAISSWMAREASFSPILATYQETGQQAELLGLSRIPENEFLVYQIRLVNPRDESEIDVFLDSISLLEVRRDFRPQPGAAVLETLFDDYRVVDGFVIPFSVTNRMNGNILSVTRINAVTLNVGLPRYYFEAPTSRQANDSPRP